MSNCELQLRWGLGPGIDPHLDAQIGRAIMQPGTKGPVELVSTGYIEFIGDAPYEYLRALLHVLYEQPPDKAGPLHGLAEALSVYQRPGWMKVSKLRYLTTDPATAIALPLYGFNPDKSPPSWPAEAPARLQKTLQDLDALSAGRLASAAMIGLTVDFQIRPMAKQFESVLRPGPLRRMFGFSEDRARAQVERILGGGIHPIAGFLTPLLRSSPGARRFGAQVLGASTGFGAQLQFALSDLRTGDPDPLAPFDPLDCGGKGSGKGTIVGFVDFGCDIAHPSFRDDEGKTRILALWDQNDEPESPSADTLIKQPPKPEIDIGGKFCRFDYGRLFVQGDIDSVLQDPRSSTDPDAPYRLLGYDPHDHHFTAQRPGPEPVPSAHGAPVMEVAVGGKRKAALLNGITSAGMPRPEVSGVAPGASIVFVQVRMNEQNDGRRLLDANDVIDAVAFIFHIAESKKLPCVVNLSLNTMSGPHDGDDYFERRLAGLLRSGSAGADVRGRAVVVAAGNLPPSMQEVSQWQHLKQRIEPGKAFEFIWRPPFQVVDRTRNSLEIWYDAKQSWLQVSLVPPNARALGPVVPGRAAEITVDGGVCGSIIGSRLRPAVVHRVDAELATSDMVAGRHVILLELDPLLAKDDWRVVLEVIDATHTVLAPGSEGALDVHAWLERDDEGQSCICRDSVLEPIQAQDRESTIGTLSCGQDAIVVGAYSTSSFDTAPSGVSGRGPSRLGHEDKPDLSAPGFGVMLIRSRQGHNPAAGYARAFGTSISAPFVSGTIARIYELFPKAPLELVRQALRDGSRLRPGAGAPARWDAEFGHGRLDPAEAILKVEELIG